MHPRVRSLMVLSAGAMTVALTACGSGGTEPRTPAGPLRMSIVGGDEQSDTIQALLQMPIRVRAMRGDSATGLTPAAGQLVNFVVVEPDCGRPFAGSATTDAQGFAIERWELGPKTATCHMEVRSVDQTTGEPVVYATAAATVKPGAVDTLAIASRQIFFIGTRVPAQVLVTRAADRRGNLIERPTLAVEASAPWAADGETIVTAATEDSTTLIVGSGL